MKTEEIISQDIKLREMISDGYFSGAQLPGNAVEGRCDNM